MEKPNSDKLNNWINIGVLSLLTLNYLFYSFFDLGHLRNSMRLLVGAMLVLSLGLQFLGNRLRRRHIVLLLLAVYQVIIGGTNSLNIAFLILIALTMQNIENKRVFKQTFVILMVFAGVVALSLVLGIQENYHYLLNGRERNTLGFSNVNNVGLFVFSLLAAFLLSLKKAKTLPLVGVAVAAIVCYYTTDSRTPFLGIIIMMALGIVIPFIPKKWAKYCLWAGIALLFITPAVWPLPFVNSEWGNWVLSLRPKYFVEYMQQQSIVTFFFGGSQVAEIDNGYLLLLYNCGIFVYSALALAAARAAEILLEKGKFMELAYLVAMLVCAMFEGTLVRPELLCTPLVWGIVFDNVCLGEEESLLIRKIRNLLGRFLPIMQEKT